MKFSLPTEAQWEYACRNRGQKNTYPWGRDSYRPEENCGTCNAGEFRGRTAVKGSFPPNDIGLYDMGGNVREWCGDVYDKKAYKTHSRENPLNRKDGKSRGGPGWIFCRHYSSLAVFSKESCHLYHEKRVYRIPSGAEKIG